MKDQLKHFFISLSRRPHANLTVRSLTQDINIGVLNLLFATDVSEVEFSPGSGSNTASRKTAANKTRFSFL